MASPEPLPAPLPATYNIQQLYPVPEEGASWVVAYWNGVKHELKTVHAFALATTTSSGGSAILVSLRYDPEVGAWLCCDTEATYCGLIPPGMSLGEYEQHDPKGHTPGGGV